MKWSYDADRAIKKSHHEFRAALCDCPNACSRPQIIDIGIIGGVLPGIFDEACTLCRACVEICDEKAITSDEEKETPLIDYDQCLMCAKGSLKNNFTFWKPIHPVRLRPENTVYA